MTVKMLSYPYDKRSFIIRSIATFSKGSALGSMVIEKRGGLGLVVAAFVIWHVAQPLMFSYMKWLSLGHQKFFMSNRQVLRVLG